MILGIPNSVFAATIEIENIDIYKSEYEYYKMSNGELTNKEASSEDYNVKLDKENNKLYLNNFTTEKEISTDLEELTIMIEGKNQITNEYNNAIYSSGNLIFSGTGSLEVEGNANGIKSPKKVTINEGTYTINGITYNGIEAEQIEINGGWIKTSGGYSGIHTQSGLEMLEEDHFYMNGGNLFTVKAKSSAINTREAKYNNCIVLIEDNRILSFNMYGNATLLKNLTLTTNITIPKDSVLTIPKGISLRLNDKNQLNLIGSILLHGQIFAGEKEFFNIYKRIREWFDKNTIQYCPRK